MNARPSPYPSPRKRGEGMPLLGYDSWRYRGVHRDENWRGRQPPYGPQHLLFLTQHFYSFR